MSGMYSCKESGEDSQQSTNSSQFMTEKNGIYVLSDKAIGYIDSTIQSDSLIVFSGNTPDDALPKVGSPFYIHESKKAPYGMLARVISVQKGANISVFTKPLSLEEAFENLSINTTSTVAEELEGVFDENDNPIDFEIVDTADIDLNNISVISKTRKELTRAHEDFKFDWDWKSQCLKFPIKLYKGKSGKDEIDITGAAHIGFRKFELKIEIKNHKLNYVNFEAIPYLKVGLDNKVKTGSKLELSDRLGKLRFKIAIPTPVGIPVIIPITWYIDGACGIIGELSAKLGLQYEYNCNCFASYTNGQWSSKTIHGGFRNKSPWVVSEFDVKGEIYSGYKIGILAGLYSATTGIGFNASPKFTISTHAKLSSTDLLRNNPKVSLNLNVGSEVYCVAKLFGKELGKYSLQFPDYILWSENAYLLPNIKEFEAVGRNTSANISWSHDKFYFLEPFGVKTGVAIFESDGVTEVKSYKPSPTDTNTNDAYYLMAVTGLKAGMTYFAAPFAYWGSYTWYGDKKAFYTEAEKRDISGTWNCTKYKDNGSILEESILVLTSDGKATEKTVSGSPFVTDQVGGWQISEDGSVNIGFSWASGSFNVSYFAEYFNGKVDNISNPSIIKGKVERRHDGNFSSSSNTYDFIMTK